MFKYGLYIVAVILLSGFFTDVFAQDFPDDFMGEVIAPGTKPAWVPDGSAVSYVHADALYIYDLEKKKSKKLLKMKIAEYHWINSDSVLVIEWADNITDRKKVEKEIKYWIVNRKGKKHTIGSITETTERIPDYNKPHRLSDGSVFVKTGTDWKIDKFPHTDKYVIFSNNITNADSAMASYRRVSWSKQEGGSIHFKDIQREIVKTLTVGSDQGDIRPSQDYSRLLTYTSNSSMIFNETGKQLFDLSDYITPDQLPDLKKMFGGAWNNAGNAVAYYEIYNTPENYYTLNYFNLETGKKSILTRTYYYSRNGLFFSPDDKSVLTYFIQDDISYITIIKLPKQTTLNDK